MQQVVTVVMLNPNELYDAEILCVAPNRDQAEKWLTDHGFKRSCIKINKKPCWVTDRYDGVITCEDHYFVSQIP